MVGGLVGVRADGGDGQRLRRSGLVRDFPAGQVLGQAPVHDLHFAEGADHDVGRLQVAVDDAPAVGEADRLAHLRERLEQPRPVGGLHLVGQGLAGDELHGQEGRAVGQRPQRVDRRDARVRQPGRDLRLADEAVGVGPRQQDLQQRPRGRGRGRRRRGRLPMPPRAISRSTR